MYFYLKNSNDKSKTRYIEDTLQNILMEIALMEKLISKWRFQFQASLVARMWRQCQTSDYLIKNNLTLLPHCLHIGPNLRNLRAKVYSPLTYVRKSNNGQVSPFFKKPIQSRFMCFCFALLASLFRLLFLTGGWVSSNARVICNTLFSVSIYNGFILTFKLHFELVVKIVDRFSVEC